jgi:hypothetical protein
MRLLLLPLSTIRQIGVPMFNFGLAYNYFTLQNHPICSFDGIVCNEDAGDTPNYDISLFPAPAGDSPDFDVHTYFDHLAEQVTFTFAFDSILAQNQPNKMILAFVVWSHRQIPQLLSLPVKRCQYDVSLHSLHRLQ